MKLKWQQAPVKTQWGDGMVEASVAIDKDHTVSLYCEREQTAKVEAMFAKPAQTDWEAVAADQAMTIALLKAEQPVQQEPVAEILDRLEVFVAGLGKAILRELREAMAEQPVQQEPVAWNDEQLQMLNFLYGAGDFDGVWFDQKHPTEKGAFWWRKHLRRLFDTPPAQRTWVGLNEDQRQQVRDICDVAIPAHVFHAIDAKLKEKNT